MIDIVQSVILIVLAFANIYNSKSINLQRKRITELETLVMEHNERRIKLYEELADPAKVEADFEKSARAREMRDAQRTTLPREGAGPPAKLYNPKMRGTKPGNWRIQRP